MARRRGGEGRKDRKKRSKEKILWISIEKEEKENVNLFFEEPKFTSRLETY